MLCALTVRELKPGTFEQFREAFMAAEGPNLPEGWVRFDMLRNAENPDEVVCFGFFDGDVAQLRASSQGSDYEGQLQAITQYVQSVGADGLYEIVEERTA